MPKKTEIVTITETPQHQGIERKLEARHLQMIAIGGTIGTGLFLNSGSLMSISGAIGALIACIFY